MRLKFGPEGKFFFVVFFRAVRRKKCQGEYMLSYLENLRDKNNRSLLGCIDGKAASSQGSSDWAGQWQGFQGSGLAKLVSMCIGQVPQTCQPSPFSTFSLLQLPFLIGIVYILSLGSFFKFHISILPSLPSSFLFGLASQRPASLFLTHASLSLIFLSDSLQTSFSLFLPLYFAPPPPSLSSLIKKEAAFTSLPKGKSCFCSFALASFILRHLKGKEPSLPCQHCSLL